ncbi:MAG TPA: tetratricopeptide repeat protein, partial [Steroidobacteraceae bacterium]|nr:tetratricopeptide repeat protein [Steroidobacteraceae bacterium]
DVDPAAVDAHRVAGKAALELHKIEQSAAHYQVVLKSSPRGPDGEFAELEAEFSEEGNLFGARQLADLLARLYPASPAALRMQAFAALRADDPAAAVRIFEAALAASGGPPAASPPDQSSPASEDAQRRELTQGLWRARILAGDSAEPLAQARDLLDRVDTAENRMDYALLLLAAQQTSAARAQLSILTPDPGSGPLALRLLGLLDYQDGKLDEAGARFAELVATGKYLDDALFYLGMIAERHQDFERALRLYAEVQTGDNAVPALLRAAAILKAHGAAPAADELLDRLVAEAPQRAPEILAARARMDAESGDLTQATAVLTRAEAEYPDSVELRYAKASLSEEHGQVADALRELKTVAALRPNDPAALNAYGYTLADNRRQLPVARRLIERAHAAAPKNASILDSMGWVLFRQGHGEEALPYLNAAYADDHDGDVAAHLGEVLWHLGRRSDAERIWSDANRTGSDNHLVNATRLRLHASNAK